MYSFQTRVRFSEVDSELHITLPAILTYFQDCSIFHSDSIGLGISRLMQEDWQDFSSALVPPDRKKGRIRTYFSGRSRIQVWASAAAGLLFMVSAGLGLMLGRYTRMEEIGGRLVISDPSQQTEKIIRLSGLDKKIEIKKKGGQA